MTAPNLQVEDNPQLLSLINEDMKGAGRFYNPTNYWSYYEKYFLNELENQGLKDFRRRRKSVLFSFGATDYSDKKLIDLTQSRLFYNKAVNRIPGWESVRGLMENAASSFISAFPSWRKSITEKPFRYAAGFGDRHAAPPLEGLEISLAGNPEDVFMIDDRPFTNSMLYYYMRFAYACRFVDFNKVNTMVELGSGSGKNVEIVKKYFPHITYLCFDISPQLYVCEQYLKSVFGNRVVSYKENRTLQNLNALKPGHIYMLGAWHFPLLADFKFDLFWNCASFQEMEPDVVANYLHYVNESAKWVYLMAKMDGKETASEGQKGVLDPVKFEHYEMGLSNFELMGNDECYYPGGKKMWDGYEETVWKRKTR